MSCRRGEEAGDECREPKLQCPRTNTQHQLYDGRTSRTATKSNLSKTQFALGPAFKRPSQLTGIVPEPLTLARFLASFPAPEKLRAHPSSCRSGNPEAFPTCSLLYAPCCQQTWCRCLNATNALFWYLRQTSTSLHPVGRPLSALPYTKSSARESCQHIQPRDCRIRGTPSSHTSLCERARMQNRSIGL